MRIRRRLTLYGVFVTALTMLGFGLLLTALASGSVPEDQDRNLESFADVLLATSPQLEDPETVPGLPLPIDIDSSTDIYVAIYGADGTALNSTGTIDGADPSLPAAVVVEAIETGSSVATAAGPRAVSRPAGPATARRACATRCAATTSWSGRSPATTATTWRTTAATAARWWTAGPATASARERARRSAATG